MTKKAPFCTFLWLKITVLSRQIRSLPTYQVGLRNLWLIKDLCLYNCRDSFTNVVSALQINLFMQNEPNFKKVKLSVSYLPKRNYEQLDTWSIRKNEPKTNPNEPKTNSILAQKTLIRTQTNPNEPKRTQNEPNSISSQRCIKTTR